MKKWGRIFNHDNCHLILVTTKFYGHRKVLRASCGHDFFGNITQSSRIAQPFTLTTNQVTPYQLFD
ncbi:MAG: hypothetical protein ABFD75_00585 [Smithella sp.]